MMRRMLLAFAACAGLASPAFASQCPALMAQIEAALASATALDDATRASVTALLDEGRAAHDGGDHATSEAKLNEALTLLGQ